MRVTSSPCMKYVVKSQTAFLVAVFDDCSNTSDNSVYMRVLTMYRLRVWVIFEVIAYIKISITVKETLNISVSKCLCMSRVTLVSFLEKYTPIYSNINHVHLEC